MELRWKLIGEGFSPGGGQEPEGVLSLQCKVDQPGLIRPEIFEAEDFTKYRPDFRREL